ncbi:MAG: hypothetical protein R3F05_07420 [Planctomycetota bacterium]
MTALAELAEGLAVICDQQDDRIAAASRLEAVEQGADDAIDVRHAAEVRAVLCVGRVRLEEVDPEKRLAAFRQPAHPVERPIDGALARPLANAVARRVVEPFVVVRVETLVQPVGLGQHGGAHERARVPARGLQPLRQQGRPARLPRGSVRLRWCARP